MAPTDDAIQPTKLIPPYAASVAGSKKIPEAIIFPTTKAMLVHKPILAVDLVSVMRDQY